MAGRQKPLPDNVIHIDGTPFTVVELDKAKRKRITAAAKERFVVLLSEGLNPSEAAYELGLTGSRMRAERKRDEEFDKACGLAQLEGEPGFKERLRSTYRRRALDPEGPPMLLHNLALVHLEEFAVLQKTKIEGNLGITAMPHIDASLYSDDELRQLQELLARKPLPEIEA